MLYNLCKKKNDWQFSILLIILFSVLTSLYLQVSSFELLHYDDDVYLTNELIPEKGVFPDLKSAATGICANLWHPVTLWSHQLCAYLAGLNGGFHHLINLALHLAVTGLLARWLLGKGAKPLAVIIVTALWALHPQRVEVVAWISARKELLLTLFCLLSLISLQNTKSRASTALFYLSAIAAYLSTPAAVVLPGLIFIDHFLFPKSSKSPLKQKIAPIIFTSILSISLSVITMQLHHTGGLSQDAAEWSIWQSFATPALSISTALQTSICPFFPALMRPSPDLSLTHVLLTWAGILSLLAVSIWALLKSATSRNISLGFYWFLICLAPVCGIVPLGDTFFADRYTYIAQLGILPFLAFLPYGKKYLSQKLAITAGLIIISFYIASYQRCSEWKSDLALFQAEVSRYPDRVPAIVNLANAHNRNNQFPLSEKLLRRALKLAPNDYKASHNLSSLLVNESTSPARRAEAISILNYIVGHPEEQPTSPWLKARAEIENEKIDQAYLTVTKGLERFPQAPSLYDLRGQILLSLNKKEEAVLDFQKAHSLEPENPKWGKHTQR